jgi:hypothetical protein
MSCATFGSEIADSAVIARMANNAAMPPIPTASHTSRRGLGRVV